MAAKKDLFAAHRAVMSKPISKELKGSLKQTAPSYRGAARYTANSERSALKLTQTPYKAGTGSVYAAPMRLVHNEPSNGRKSQLQARVANNQTREYRTGFGDNLSAALKRLNTSKKPKK